jgi:hypothetical protein
MFQNSLQHPRFGRNPQVATHFRGLSAVPTPSRPWQEWRSFHKPRVPFSHALSHLQSQGGPTAAPAPASRRLLGERRSSLPANGESAGPLLRFESENAFRQLTFPFPPLPREESCSAVPIAACGTSSIGDSSGEENVAAPSAALSHCYSHGRRFRGDALPEHGP